MRGRLLSIAFALTGALGHTASGAEWRFVLPLPEPRWFHMAGVGSNGRIYVYGGSVRPTPGGFHESANEAYALVVYDPQTATWSRGASPRGRPPHEMPAGRADPLGRPYWPWPSGWTPFDPEAGGWGPAISARSRRVSLDELSGWETTGPAHHRYTPTLATSREGLVYITGGSARPYFYPRGEVAPYPYATAAVEVWDARSNEWRELAPMRHARILHAAAFDRAGRLFVFGGSETAGGVECDPVDGCGERSERAHQQARRSLASVEMYDPVTNVWTERAPLPTPRQAMAAELGADGLIYVVGGAPSYQHPRPMEVVEVYDPERNRWHTGPPLQHRRRSHAVVVTPDGKLYAIGGWVGRRERALRERLSLQFVDPALGATVEVLDTAPARSPRLP